MIPVVKTVQTTLMRLTFFTALDFRLFTNIMDYMPYEDVKTVAREIRDHAALMQQLSEAGSSVCDRFFSTYELKNMTDILFHFLTRAYQEEDEFALQEVMSFLSAFQVPRQEWYFNFVAKLASVYDLVHKGDAVVARHTYDQLMDTLAFMLPADVQADYLDMTRGSFELFVDEMKPRLHQIDKRLITNGHRR
ncbi:MAG: hypothetical protein LBT80_01890 [Lactobacillaceae bacterium]|jgi:hypothetical protein|nr:hypothetical protein [Lactobacillaceae bacterium]